MLSHLSTNSDGTGNHARGSVITRITQHNNRSAAHAVTQSLSRIAIDGNPASTHPSPHA
jgi:hypothetical protein